MRLSVEQYSNVETRLILLNMNYYYIFNVVFFKIKKKIFLETDLWYVHVLPCRLQDVERRAEGVGGTAESGEEPADVEHLLALRHVRQHEQQVAHQDGQQHHDHRPLASNPEATRVQIPVGLCQLR